MRHPHLEIRGLCVLNLETEGKLSKKDPWNFVQLLFCRHSSTDSSNQINLVRIVPVKLPTVAVAQLQIHTHTNENISACSQWVTCCSRMSQNHTLPLQQVRNTRAVFSSELFKKNTTLPVSSNTAALSCCVASSTIQTASQCDGYTFTAWASKVRPHQLGASKFQDVGHLRVGAFLVSMHQTQRAASVFESSIVLISQCLCGFHCNTVCVCVCVYVWGGGESQDL